MIVTSVQIKTAKTQKHLYCPVFTRKALAIASAFFIEFFSKKVGKTKNTYLKSAE